MRGFSPIDALAGTTIRATWVSSGVTPSGIYARILDKNETLISSMAAISSGSGFYYAQFTMPGSRQWLVNEWVATIDGYPWISRQLVRVLTMEVD